MNDDESDDKPFPASLKKIQDARKKGNVARSMDLNVAFSYLGLLSVILFAMEIIFLDSFSTLQYFFQEAVYISARHSYFAGNLASFIFSASWQFLLFFLPPFLFVLVSIGIQRAFVFSFSSIRVDIKRISIVENAKKKFGFLGIFEFFKSFCKLVMYGLILLIVLYRGVEKLVQLPDAEFGVILGLSKLLLLEFLIILCVTASVIGLIDLLFQRNAHAKKLRMSRKELMDELKDTEGDPRLRQKRHQRAMEFSTSEMVNDTKTADVVIVNPSHYAVVLKWSRKTGSAPLCVAKGVDDFALTLKRIANENLIPIFHAPPTARALYATVDVGAEIGSEFYQAVAVAIRFADNLQRKSKNSLISA